MPPHTRLAPFPVPSDSENEKTEGPVGSPGPTQGGQRWNLGLSLGACCLWVPGLGPCTWWPTAGEPCPLVGLFLLFLVPLPGLDSSPTPSRGVWGGSWSPQNS